MVDNSLMQFILDYPLKRYDWASLSKHPKITGEMIEKYDNFPWVWYRVFENINIDFNFMMRNKDKYFNFLMKKENKEYFEEYFICDEKDKDKEYEKFVNDYFWEQISIHPSITWDFIDEHPEYPWCWLLISINPNVNIDIIKNNPDKPWIMDSIGDFISRNPSTTIEHVIKHQDIKWNYGFLSSNKTITIDFVLANKDKKFIWSVLSRHPNITFDDIMKNKDLPWNWELVAINPNVKISNIERHPEIPWSSNPESWEGISLNPNITIKDIKKHIETKKFEWYYLSCNPSLTWDIIKENNDLPWDINGLSLNPNITIDIIRKHKSKIIKKMPFISWNMINISKNHYI